LYKVLAANVSVADLLAKAANLSDADSARSLMNLVMQFRKVCNHPELFERADVVAPFSFSRFGRTLPSSREVEPVDLPNSSRNPIEFKIPELLWEGGGLLDVPHEGDELRGDSNCLAKLMNIWSTDWIHRSLQQGAAYPFMITRYSAKSIYRAFFILVPAFPGYNTLRCSQDPHFSSHPPEVDGSRR
jgi:DNA helicase INO80